MIMNAKIMTLKPLPQPKTLKEMAYSSIKEAILTGVMESGVIYSEPSLGEMLNISRTPTREALQRLAGEGFVEAIPKRGYKIKSLSISEINNLYDFRMTIELAIVKIAASVMTKEDNIVLDEIMRQDQHYAETEDIENFIRTNRSLHRFLAERTRNPYFIESLDKILELIEWAALDVPDRTTRAPQAIEEHKAIIMALQSGDGEQACEAMENHLMISKKMALRARGV